MKKIFFMLVLGSLMACSGNHESTSTSVPESLPAVEQEASQKQYACSMKCEGEKTYTEAGTCPVCGMELKEVAMAETDSTMHDHIAN